MWKFLSKWRYPKIIQVIGSYMLVSMGKSMAWGPYFKKASCSPRLWTPWLLTLTWLLPWRASLSYPMAMTAMVRTLGTCLDPHNFYCHSSIEASILGQLSIDFLYAPPTLYAVFFLGGGSSWQLEKLQKKVSSLHQVSWLPLSLWRSHVQELRKVFAILVQFNLVNRLKYLDTLESLVNLPLSMFINIQAPKSSKKLQKHIQPSISSAESAKKSPVWWVPRCRAASRPPWNPEAWHWSIPVPWEEYGNFTPAKPSLYLFCLHRKEVMPNIFFLISWHLIPASNTRLSRCPHATSMDYNG